MIALRIGLLLALGLTLTLAEDEVIKCPGGECVKLHLCRDNSIVTDGSNLIDIRFNPDDPCEHYLLKCCAVPDDENVEIVEPPSTGEFVEPPSSGPQSGNLIGSNSGSTASSGSSGSTGSTGSSSGSTGSTGQSGSSGGHGREDEGIENPGNYHGGSYPHGGGSFSSTFSQSASSSSSSSSSQSYQQQWTGPQGPYGMGVGGGGSNIGGYGTNQPGSIGYNTGHPGIIAQGPGQMAPVGHGTTQVGHGISQSGIWNAQGTGQTGQATGGIGSQGYGGGQPGSSGQGQTGHGTAQTGSVGLGTGQSGSMGHTITQTGTTAGGSLAQAGHGSSQSGINAQGTGQTGQATGGMGSLGHGGGQPVLPGQGTGQTVSAGGHSTTQTGSVGLTTGQSGSMGHTISQTGTTAGGSLAQAGHGTSQAGIKTQGTGQTGQGTGAIGSQGYGGGQPGSSGQGQTGHGTAQTGSVGLTTGQSGSMGHTISQTGTTAAGSLAQAGHGTNQAGIKTQGTGQTGQGTGGMGSLGLGGGQPGLSGQGTGQTVSVGGGSVQTGQGTSGYNRTSGISSGTMHGSAGGVVSSQNAGLSSGGSSAGGYENTGTHNLEGLNLIAGDLHSGTTGASGTYTGGHSIQGQVATHQTEQFANVGSTNVAGGQSGAYQAVGSGRPGAENSMHGTGNIVPGVGIVTKDQTKDTSNVSAGSSTINTSGISQHGQTSSNHQYQDNSLATSHTSQNTQSTNNVGLNQGHGQGQTGSSTVKHYEGDGCTSHTQKHTSHTQHHGHVKGNEHTQHSYGSGNNNMYYAGTTVNPILPPQENVGCGFRNPDGVGFRITGNSDGEAEYGEFPWMVAILKEEKALDQVINVYQCGGSLIHPRVVLTAAHCVQNKKPHEIKVRLGEWDTQTTNEIHDHQDRNVVEIVVHDKFYKGGLFNDFALLFLDKPAEIIETVNTVCLPPQDFNFDLSRCFASGWGKDVFGKEGKYQVILKKIELPVMPFNKCQDALRTTRLGKRFKLNSSFICAGGEPKKDTCKGDGGSPLVCPIPGSTNRFYQAGIVAWGIGCGEHGIPGVYANVAGFRTWIDEHLTQRSIPHDYYIAP